MVVAIALNGVEKCLTIGAVTARRVNHCAACEHSDGCLRAHFCPKSITGRRLSRLGDSSREENVNDKIMKQVSIPVGATRLKCRQHCVIISAGVTL